MLNESEHSIPNSTIQVHIEELVLHGFHPNQRHQIGEALERELARLFGERGVPGPFRESATIEDLNGGLFQMKSRSKAEAVGSDLALAVYGGLHQ
jgi:hypothetical protein